MNLNANVSLGYFDVGNTVSYSFNPTNKCVVVFFIEGSVTLNGVAIERRDAIGVWDTGDITIPLYPGGRIFNY